MLHALDCGTRREQANNRPFSERFGISINLAKAQIGQKKHEYAEQTLESLRDIIDQGEQEFALLTCTFAKLYGVWYNEVHDW